MVPGSPELRTRVSGATADGFTIKAPRWPARLLRGGPKSRGGAAARGVDILEAIMDEAEFMPTIDSVNAPVTDSDIIGALMPRLLRESELLLTSTPWPVLSATSALFDRNWQAPLTALVARAPTPIMRDEDPLIMGTIAFERERDESNASREYFCEQVSIGATFFDHDAIARAVTADPVPVVSSGVRAVACAAIDLGFKVDPSTLCVIRREGRQAVVVHLEEMKPRPGQPLQPSVVCGRFATAAKGFGCSSLISDAHYLETAREHAGAIGVVVESGPAGAQGKEKSYVAFRDALREGTIVIPNSGSPLVQRLIGRMRNVTSRAQPGGGLAITSPRRSGAHGDLPRPWCSPSGSRETRRGRSSRRVSIRVSSSAAPKFLGWETAIDAARRRARSISS